MRGIRSIPKKGHMDYVFIKNENAVLAWIFMGNYYYVHSALKLILSV